jgi:hypothetical protein
MTSPIDPLRRAARLRRGVRTESEAAAEATTETGFSNLPVPAEPARAVPPPAPPPAAAAATAAFGAQLLGQDGQKRGLRAGPAAIEGANTSYNRVEWSGSKDRRARKGRYQTEV